jgi:tRNA pseudouridine55 synthase
VLTPADDGDKVCVSWDVFERASVDAGEPDDEGWLEWEREVIDKLEIVQEKTN